MMKKYIILSIIALGMCLTSCDDYLDKLPDDRAEMDSQDKVTQLLVSAYLSHSPNFLFLMSSDDVDDNGKVYSAQQNQEQMYRWQTVEGRNNDDPRSLWQDYYEKAATANLALATIEKMGNPESLRGQRAEALLCR
ncbi:MAG: RagB/SusD family nutrient uptake outer membrane protein, partial [Prevotella sp.]|nr:RagB/SusD family nutrient uptake outer membrane protein [Prevotella sp.]